MTDTYITMAQIYDEWMQREGTPYPDWCRFIGARFSAASTTVSSVVDIGCGTGELTQLLSQAGYSLVGLDASAEMVRLARQKLPTQVRVVLGEVPGTQLPELGKFQGAVCSFDVINYLRDQRALLNCFSQVSSVLEPGGRFVFDVNTRSKLAEFYANNHYGDDWGDVAYVWRSRYAPDTRACEFLLTFFVNGPDGWLRRTERHVERWFSHEELREAARLAQLDVLEVVDGYSDRPVTPTTRRETWVLEKRAS